MFYPIKELRKRQAQIEYAHSMLLRHHESTQSLEYKHLDEMHRLRNTQMRKQHDTELTNQKEYTSREERKLRQKHAMQVKAQPKSLKVIKERLPHCFVTLKLISSCCARASFPCVIKYLTDNQSDSQFESMYVSAQDRLLFNLTCPFIAWVLIRLCCE